MDTKSELNSALCPLLARDELEDFLQLDLGISKSQIKKFIPSKKNRARPVRANSTLLVPLGLLNGNIINPSYAGPAIGVIRDDGDVLALDKPAGVHCHPLSYGESDNCLSYLRSKGGDSFLAPLKVNQERYDRGLLHRLDHGTSGVLLLAKRPGIYEQVRADFNGVSKKKIYVALAEGRVQAGPKLQHFFHPHGPGGESQRVSGQGPGAMGELTIVRAVYQEALDLSWVAIELHTGLRHQIRAQLAHLGWPIVGDVQYGGRASCRIFLHSHEYQLVLEGKTVQVTAPVPESFRDAWGPGELPSL